jgi:glycine/D-amino acid oxidase-like deaminating enzyme
MYMLERTREHGARLLQARVEGVEVVGNRMRSVRLSQGGIPGAISTNNFVNAGGPFLKNVGQMVGIDLPVFSELHAKIAFRDTVGAVPRNAPMIIWNDPTFLLWSEEERSMLAEAEETKGLLDTFPSGIHTRPEGRSDSDILLIIWTYDNTPVEPVFPITFDPRIPEIALRGLVTVIPEMRTYVGRIPKPLVDGGYYTKTRENRPLIGPLPVEGTYVIGALSGFGIMAACASGELLAAHLTGSELPHYAPAFGLERYEDPHYQKLLDNWGESGQL